MARNTLLPIAREVAIQKLAEGIATNQFPSGRVEPEQIATAENIAFTYASFPEEFDGTLIHHSGRFFIVCNNRLHPQGSSRSRFTFAHELGHYFILEHRAALTAGGWPAHYSRTEFISDDPLEAEADCFAANLLLPAAAVRRFAATLAAAGFAKIELVATEFGVSLTAAAYRLLGLGLFRAPAAFFHWDAMGACASRRMSDATAQLGRNYCALIDVPPANSVTAEAVTQLRVGVRTGESHIMNWFPKLTGYDRGDQSVLREEVKSLGHYGWATLIHANE